VVARFEADGVRFEVVPGSGSGKVGGQGNARLCLEVDDVEAALAELRSRGVATGEAHAKPGGILGTFSDPDGNEICLWQYRREP
jgi:predicted enzyme related to lactoylglutathione lyase